MVSNFSTAIVVWVVQEVLPNYYLNQLGYLDSSGCPNYTSPDYPDCTILDLVADADSLVDYFFIQEELIEGLVLLD